MRFKTSTTLLIVIVTLVSSASICRGQGSNDPRQIDRRRELVDGILQTLVDAEIQSIPDRLPGDRSVVQPAQLSPEMREARAAISELSADTTRLINSLYGEQSYSQQVRPLLGDALRVKASTEVMLQLSEYYTMPVELIMDFEALDRQWRLLSQRIRQIPTLSSGVLQAVERVHQSDRKLGKLLGVQPQVDLNQLQQTASGLAGSFRKLVEDVQLYTRNTPSRDALLNAGRGVQLRLNDFRLAIQQSRPYDDLTARYKLFRDGWYAMRRTLRLVNHATLQRDMLEMAAGDDAIHQLLWLNKELDREEVAYLTSVLGRDSDGLFDGISLKSLIRLPRASEVVGVVQEFNQRTADFSQSVASNAKIDDLIWDFRVLEVQWQAVREKLAPLNPKSGVISLDNIGEIVAALREALGVQDLMEQNVPVQLASDLESLADQLHQDMVRYIRRPRYTAKFVADATGASSRFLDLAKYAHQGIVDNQDADRMRQITDAMGRQWTDVTNTINRVPPEEQQVLVRTSAQIPAVMAKLQLLYGY
ncbi:MAG: hypothetical protein R3E01_32620 [Pirellulaceae bacterium]|nr:hypothetical protein [Planctomycetales bacterium]